MNTTEYQCRFKRGDRVLLTKELDWTSDTAPRPGDVGTVIEPGIVTCRVGFSLKQGIVAVAPRKLERV